MLPRVSGMTASTAQANQECFPAAQFGPHGFKRRILYSLTLSARAGDVGPAVAARVEEPSFGLRSAQIRLEFAPAIGPSQDAVKMRCRAGVHLIDIRPVTSVAAPRGEPF